MIIFFFVTISVTYAIYLLRSNFRFISLLFLTVFSISFLLPIIMDKPFNYKLYLDASNYDYTNKLYLLALIVFVVTNLIIQLANIKFEMNNLLIIKTKNIDNIYPIYVLATIVVIMLTGLNIFTGGSTATLENSSIMKMLQGSVLLGYLYLSYLYLYNSNNTRNKVKSLFLILISVIVVTIFIFGRRILIYPTIAILVLYIYKKGKTPNLLHLSAIALSTILIILPLMMSIRTYGLKDGFVNFKDILVGDYNKYIDYLAVGTDVNYSYSLATIITNYQVHVNILTLFKPLFIFIPRSIWPNKPQPLSEEIVKKLNFPFDQGMSIPPGFVGEAYIYLGVFGIILASIIFAIFCGLADQYSLSLRKAENGIYSINLILITILSIQLIMGSIRGDTATNIQEALYLFIPLALLLWLSQIKLKFK